MMMYASRSSEILVEFYRTIRRRMPENSHRYSAQMSQIEVRDLIGNKETQSYSDRLRTRIICFAFLFLERNAVHSEE